jgi:hypothetical protein
MQRRKFPVLVNPFGVVYNPISVKLVLDRIFSTTPFTEDDLVHRNGLWFSYLHHTSFSSSQKETCLATINDELNKAISFIKHTKYLLITFGTARVYYLKKDGQPVGNCHKVPAKEFENFLISVDEIFVEWSVLLNKIFTLNKDIKVIFTVSPVRHWKDGAEGNQLSKSILHLAVNELIKIDPDKLFYFPTYEIMMDDLRDYRFYADDMLHPSQQAIEYIWDKFFESTIHEDSIILMKQIEKIMTAVEHRPFNPETPEHSTFIKNTLKQIQKITASNPKINFSEEEMFLNSFLK